MQNRQHEDPFAGLSGLPVPVPASSSSSSLSSSHPQIVGNMNTAYRPNMNSATSNVPTTMMPSQTMMMMQSSSGSMSGGMAMGSSRVGPMQPSAAFPAAPTASSLASSVDPFQSIQSLLQQQQQKPTPYVQAPVPHMSSLNPSLVMQQANSSLPLGFPSTAPPPIPKSRPMTPPLPQPTSSNAFDPFSFSSTSRSTPSSSLPSLDPFSFSSSSSAPTPLLPSSSSIDPFNGFPDKNSSPADPFSMSSFTGVDLFGTAFGGVSIDPFTGQPLDLPLPIKPHSETHIKTEAKTGTQTMRIDPFTGQPLDLPLPSKSQTEARTETQTMRIDPFHPSSMPIPTAMDPFSLGNPVSDPFDCSSPPFPPPPPPPQSNNISGIGGSTSRTFTAVQSVAGLMPSTSLGNPFSDDVSYGADDDEEVFDLHTAPPIPGASRPGIREDEDEGEDPAAALRRLKAMYSVADTTKRSGVSNDVDGEDEDDDAFKYTGPKVKPADVVVTHPTEGDIMARISSRSLFTKSWEPMFWVIDDHDLYLYKNRGDYLHSSKYSGYKKKIPIVHNLRVLKIHRKDYPGLGPMLNFMLEEVYDYGPMNVAKFASANKDNIEALYNQLRDRILQKRKMR